MFKKRVGITQRVVQHPFHNELMDCLDTNWARFLLNLEILPVPLPLLPAELAPSIWAELKLDGLILSGGNTLADYADINDDPTTISPDRDHYECAILKEALLTSSPILGICRGLQLINVYFGGKLERIKGHAGSRHPLNFEVDNIHYEFGREVNSYHDFAVPRDGLGKKLIPLACDDMDNIEAFCHPSEMLLAIMWHPERDINPSKNDCKIIKEHFGV